MDDWTKTERLKMYDDFVNLLLSVSDNQLDSRIKSYIKKWSSPPKPLEVLEVLDHCINGALASTSIVILLQTMYSRICKDSNVSHDEVAKQASWRI